ncbi:hypothetical protein SZ54_3119 [Rhizobium sp. UR51a]|nr:hypothetical protein SZ54_3119 [Rhizobium sp. UR51a]
MRSLHISLVIGSMSSPIISFLTTAAPPFDRNQFAFHLNC